jgi:iron complex outermembrane receptor protein
MDYVNQLVLTGKINDVGEYIRENVKDSYRTGIEAEATVAISPKLTVNANATISRNIIKLYREYVGDYDGGPQVIHEYENSTISFSPELISAGMITFLPVKNFSVTLVGKYIGRQFLDNTSDNSRSIDPYVVSNMLFEYKIHPGKIRSIAFRFSLNNFLNSTYESNGYTYSEFRGGQRYDYNDYYPQAKLNYLGGIEISF